MSRQIVCSYRKRHMISRFKFWLERCECRWLVLRTTRRAISVRGTVRRAVGYCLGGGGPLACRWRLGLLQELRTLIIPVYGQLSLRLGCSVAFPRLCEQCLRPIHDAVAVAELLPAADLRAQ